MASSTSAIGTISASQSGKEITANGLFLAASPAIAFGRDPDHCSGLTWGIFEGVLSIAGTPTEIAAQTVTLDASDTNYLYLTSSGTLTQATSSPTGWPGPITSPAGAIALYDVVTGTDTVTSYTDWRGIGTGSGSSGSSISIARLSDQKTSGTEGGATTSGAYNTRALNTEDYDPDGIVSLSSNAFTLGAGTYHIAWRAPAYKANQHKTRLYNVTDAAVVAVGSNAFCYQSEVEQSDSVGTTLITITGSKAYRIEHRLSNVASVYDWGRPCSFSDAEVYTVVDILKLA